MGGQRSEIRDVTVESVLAIHDHLVAEFESTSDPISPPGLRSRALLESAVARQFTGFQGVYKYETPLACTASLMFGICNNHPFHNGNKRIALVTGLLHMDSNGFVLHRTNRDQLYDLMIRIASHAMVGEALKGRTRRGDVDAEIRELEDWLDRRARRIVRGERPITYGRLYEILKRFGFRLGDKNKNKVEVQRRVSILGIPAWKSVYKVHCPGDGLTISTNEIKQIRRVLRLDEDHGIDSYDFYGEQTIIDEYISHYRPVLRRLARA